MRLFLLLAGVICLTVTSCKKPTDKPIEKPKSKTDYIPIISANTSPEVALGESIKSKVKMGFYSLSASVTFLNFDVKETTERQYDIRAKGFFDNINYAISLPVVMTFDTILSIRPKIKGQHILRLYSALQLVQTDTVQVN